MNSLFSINRLGKYARFYLPMEKKIAVFTVLCVVLGYILCQISTMGTPGVGLFSLGSFIILLPFYAAPLTFSRNTEPSMTIGLPVSWVEKSVGMLGFCFVVVPLTMTIIWYICVGFGALFCAHADPAIYMQKYIVASSEINFDDMQNFNESGKFLNYISSMYAPAIGLFAVVNARKAKLTWGILSQIIAYIAVSIISGIYFAVIGFRIGLSQAMNGGADTLDPDEVAQSIIDNLKEMLPVFEFAILAVVIVVIALTVYKIKSKHV